MKENIYQNKYWKYARSLSDTPFRGKQKFRERPKATRLIVPERDLNLIDRSLRFIQILKLQKTFSESK